MSATSITYVKLPDGDRRTVVAIACDGCGATTDTDAEEFRLGWMTLLGSADDGNFHACRWRCVAELARRRLAS